MVRVYVMEPGRIQVFNPYPLSVRVVDIQWALPIST